MSGSNGLKISKSAYMEVLRGLKNELGIKIEYPNGAGGKYDMVGCFNKMKSSDKDAIAASFDSLLDLTLKDDLLSIMKKCGVRKYTDLLKGKKGSGKALKEAGIIIQAVDEKGNVIKDINKVKAGHRNWLISRVDSEGNVMKDANGKLEQFKWKDFNSDSYIQGAEANVNELLAAAGYDCVSYLKLTDEQKAMVKNDSIARYSSTGTLVSGTDNVAVGQTATDSSATGSTTDLTASSTTGSTKELMNALLADLFDADKLLNTDKTNATEDKEEVESTDEADEADEAEETDKKEELTLTEFWDKVQELVNEKQITKDEAIKVIEEEYICPARDFSF